LQRCGAPRDVHLVEPVQDKRDSLSCDQRSGLGLTTAVLK
jgi:hypothetical protein